MERYNLGCDGHNRRQAMLHLCLDAHGHGISFLMGRSCSLCYDILRADLHLILSDSPSICYNCLLFSHSCSYTETRTLCFLSVVTIRYRAHPDFSFVPSVFAYIFSRTEVSFVFRLTPHIYLLSE